MRKLIITILFMNVSVVTFAQKIPANIIKKATAANIINSISCPDMNISPDFFLLLTFYCKNSLLQSYLLILQFL